MEVVLTATFDGETAKGLWSARQKGWRRGRERHVDGQQKMIEAGAGIVAGSRSFIPQPR